MSNDYYRNGRNYELFIRKTFNCERGKRYGADESLMIKLFINEQQEKNSKSSIPYDRQLYKVKMYIEDALLKLKKRKKYIDSYNHFSPLFLKLRNSKTPNDLAKVVSTGLSKIIELENELKRNR